MRTSWLLIVACSAASIWGGGRGWAAEAPVATTPAVAWPRPLHVSVLVAGQDHPGHNMLLLAFRPSVMVTRGRWQAALDLQYASGDSSVELGTVSTTLLTATVAAGPWFSLGRLRLDVSACATLGQAWMRGEAADPDATVAGTGNGPVAIAAGRVGIEVPTRARISYVRATAEVGSTIHGLEADVNGRAAAGVAGAYVLIAVGFGATL